MNSSTNLLAIERCERFQKMLLQFAGPLSAGGFEQRAGEIAAQLADALTSTHVGIWLRKEDSLHAQALLNASSSSPLCVLKRDAHPQLFAELAELQSPIAKQPCEETQAWCIDPTTHTLLQVPLQLHDQTLGVLCVGRANPEWSADEKLFCASTATLLSQLWLLHQKQRETLGQFAGGVAHHFNNQLTGIIGLSELLAQALERTQDQDMRGYLESIITSANKAAQTSNRLLFFARKGILQKAPVDLHTLLQKLIRSLEKALPPHIQIETKLEATHSWILADQNRLHELCTDLSQNAIEAMPQGGTIRFHTTNPPSHPPTLELHIQDSGTGMDEETQKRIFDPFFSTKPPGTNCGLSLAAAFGVIQQHQGQLHFTSTPQQGSTFSVQLPTYRQPQILVVDDDPTVRRTFQACLKRLAVHPLIFATALEAIAHFRTHKDNIDLVISDLSMPNIDGFELCQRLRAIEPEVKIIIVSGYNPTTNNLSPHSSDDFLQKPFRINDLRAILQRHLPQHSKHLQNPTL